MILLDPLLAGFLGEQAALVFFVEMAPPSFADVGLHALHLVFADADAAELDAGVFRIGHQLHLNDEPEIGHRFLRRQIAVGVFVGGFADDFAVADTPIVGVFFPVG